MRDVREMKCLMPCTQSLKGMKVSRRGVLNIVPLSSTSRLTLLNRNPCQSIPPQGSIPFVKRVAVADGVLSLVVTAGKRRSSFAPSRRRIVLPPVVVAVFVLVHLDVHHEEYEDVANDESSATNDSVDQNLGFRLWFSNPYGCLTFCLGHLIGLLTRSLVDRVTRRATLVGRMTRIKSSNGLRGGIIWWRGFQVVQELEGDSLEEGHLVWIIFGGDGVKDATPSLILEVSFEGLGLLSPVDLEFRNQILPERHSVCLVVVLDLERDTCREIAKEDNNMIHSVIRISVVTIERIAVVK
jgi:hypothetical protein